MVKARWEGDSVSNEKLVVTPLTQTEKDALPEWVIKSVESIGIAIYDGIAYSSNEKTAREKLEF